MFFRNHFQQRIFDISKISHYTVTNNTINEPLHARKANLQTTCQKA